MEQNRKFVGNTIQKFDNEIDLRDFISLLWGNKWFIAIIAVVCLILSMFYVAVRPPQYSANLLLQVENRTSGIGGIEQGGVGIPSFRQESSPVDVQTVLIKSRYILEVVVKALGLDLQIQPRYFPLIGEWYARHHSEVLLPPILGLSHYAWGGESLKISKFIVPSSQENHSYRLVVLNNKQYQLYDRHHHLILTGREGEIATAIIPKVGRFELNVSELKANQGEQFFIYKKASESIVAGIINKLEINDLAQANSIPGRTGVLRVKFTGNNPQKVVSLLNSLAQVVVDKNIEKKSTEAIQTSAFLNQQLPIVKKSLDEAELALNNYQAKTGAINLDDAVKILLAQVSEIQKQISEIQMQRAVALRKYTLLHPVILELQDRELEMKRQLKALELKISKLPANEQVAMGLMRDVKVKSELYLLLLNKIQALQVSKAGTVSDIRILSLAEFPYAPVSINKMVIFIGSLMLGLILGSLVVIIKNALHRKLIDPAQIESKFNLTNVAIVPFSHKQKELFAREDSKTNIMPLLAKSAPRDLSIEALRSLRTSLQFAMLESKNNIVSILGVASGVGKSFISANFAYLLADVGKKILLIDGDIRKGHLKDYFKIGKYYGLSEVIEGACDFEKAVIKNQYNNLDFLGTGGYPQNPSELLMSDRFKHLLQYVSMKYDLVIIDTPPILAVTDAAVIGHHAGTNFMVLASNVHEENEIELALKRFSSNGVKINGVVFNFKKLEKGVRHYGYQYNYQYKYE